MSDLGAGSQNLSRFIWYGVDQSGRLCSGALDSVDIEQAKQTLSRNNFRQLVVNLENSSSSLGAFERWRKLYRYRPSKLQQAMFARQLSTLLAAGIPFLRALEVMVDETADQKMSALIAAIASDLEQGSSFHQALQNRQNSFDDLFLHLVKAGEMSGALDLALAELAKQKEKSLELTRKIRGAMIHPLSVLAIAVVVTLVLLTKVVPEFAVMLSAQGQALPTLTRSVIDLSNAVKAQSISVTLSLLLTAFAIQQIFSRWPRAQRLGYRALLNLPLLGPIHRDTCVARFVRALSSTYSSGIPLAECLNLAAASCTNSQFRAAAVQIERSVENGVMLHRAFRSTEEFPKLVVNMIAIGEEAGALDSMLAKAAGHYEAQVDQRIEKLLPLIEPILMLLLGALVGGLIIAMYLPIFQMGALFSA